jgi:hypothetical protein
MTMPVGVEVMTTADPAVIAAANEFAAAWMGMAARTAVIAPSKIPLNRSPGTVIGAVTAIGIPIKTVIKVAIEVGIETRTVTAIGIAIKTVIRIGTATKIGIGIAIRTVIRIGIATVTSTVIEIVTVMVATGIGIETAIGTAATNPPRFT